MIKQIHLLLASLIFASCNSPGGKTAEKKEEKKDTIEFAKGKMLFDREDCGGCHAESQAIVGPSFQHLAAEYPATEANITHLGHIVMLGVKPNQGIWGSREMPPHPKLSREEAEEIVKYMLSFPADPNKPHLHNTK
ncbi:MAG: c-type cytochrome [Arcticibacter sp.]